MENTSVLITRSQAGDKEAREVLIEKNLGLVRHVARRFDGRGVEAEDLFQIGVIGLIKAIDKFDVSLGLQFSTYAVPMILGEIKRFLRDDGPIKVSRTIREHAVRLARARESFFRRAGREPRLDELAKEAGLSREEAILAMEADACVESLEKGQEAEDGTALPLIERIAGDTAGGFGRASTSPGERDEEKEKLLDRMVLQELMEGLPMEDRKLIYLRFFRDQTQAEVSKSLGISQVQVSRREKKILIKLRQEIIS